MATDIFLMTPDQVVTTLFHDPAAGAGMFPDEPDVDFILATYRDLAGLARYGWAPYLNNPKLERRLHRITAPTLVLWADDDRRRSRSSTAAATPSGSPTRRCRSSRTAATPCTSSSPRRSPTPSPSSSCSGSESAT